MNDIKIHIKNLQNSHDSQCPCGFFASLAELRTAESKLQAFSPNSWLSEGKRWTNTSQDHIKQLINNKLSIQNQSKKLEFSPFSSMLIAPLITKHRGSMPRSLRVTARSAGLKTIQSPTATRSTATKIQLIQPCFDSFFTIILLRYSSSHDLEIILHRSGWICLRLVCALQTQALSLCLRSTHKRAT